jgi:hypothetical protein
VVPAASPGRAPFSSRDLPAMTPLQDRPLLPSPSACRPSSPGRHAKAAPRLQLRPAAPPSIALTGDDQRSPPPLLLPSGRSPPPQPQRPPARRVPSTAPHCPEARRPKVNARIFPPTTIDGHQSS